MAASLEARNPMLDWRVVNYMLSMPASMKVQGKQFKWVLFELAKRYGPIEAIDRPKRGFTPPLGQWIVQAADVLGQVFTASQTWTAQLFNPQWQTFLQAGKFTQQHTMPVFYSLMFTKWCEKYADYIEPDFSLDTSSIAMPATTKDHHWHQSTLALDQTTLAQGKLFAHLFNHFDAGDAVLLVGDHDGWFSRIADHGGKKITRLVGADDWSESQVVSLTQTDQVPQLEASQCSQADVAGTIMVGMKNIASQIQAREFAGRRLVCLIPFQASEQPAVQVLLQQIAALGTVAGHQVVTLAPQQLALVVRCELD